MVQNTKEILIWVGLVAAVSAGAAGLLGSGVISSAQTESLEIAEASFKRAGTADGVLTVAVKNAGTSQIENIVVGINQITIGSTDLTANADFTDNADGNTVSTNNAWTSGSLYFRGDQDVSAGQTVYYSATVPNSSGISIGQSFTITANGVIGTNPIVESGVVTVTGF